MGDDMGKISKKIIAVLLAAFISATSLNIGGASYVKAAEAQDTEKVIKVGQTIDVPAQNGRHRCTFSFTPEKTGGYVFIVNGNGVSEYYNTYSVKSEESTYLSYYSTDTDNEYINLRKYSNLKVGVKYTITIEYTAHEGSSLTFTVDYPSKYLYFATVYNKKSYSTSSGGITVPYTGKPFDMYDYTLAYQSIDDSSVYNKLELGKDYKILKYTTKSNYDRSGMIDSLIWKDGSPTEVGDYVVRLQGLGSVKGFYDLYVSIETFFDPSYVDINELKKSVKNIEIGVDEAVVYAVRPQTTGDYIILAKGLDENPIGVSTIIYDQAGSYPKQINLVEEYYFGSSSAICVKLEGGKVYYLCVRGYKLNSNDSDDQPRHKMQLMIVGETTAYIYKDPNAPKADTKKPGTDTSNQEKALAKGKKFTVGNLVYKVTTSKKGNYQVSLVSCKNKKLKAVTVPASVKYKGVSYKVTGIGANAFKKMSSLKKITIKSTTIKKVGANAFKGINKNAVIKVPKSKKKAYEKLFKGKGQVNIK